MSFIQYNSIKIDGDNNLVLQSVDGETLRVSLSEFIDKFTREKDERITLLQKALYDKEKIETFSDEKIASLSVELQRITEERDAQTVQITKMVEDFAQKDITASSGLYQQAFNLFLAAKLDEALSLLSEARLQEELALIEERDKHARRDLADSYLLRSEMLQLQFDFAGAGACIEKAVEICPEWAYYLEAGIFFKFINRLTEADQYYQHALLGAGDDPYKKASTLNNLANLQSDQNEYEKAEINYYEALGNYKQLPDSNLQVHAPLVATTLNNLAVLQNSLNEFDKAEAHYNEALEIRRQLSKADPQTYLRDVAMTLNNLANLQNDQDKQDNAEANYYEALEIYRQLVEANPQTYLPNLGSTLNNLAILQSGRKQYDRAKANFIKALEIRRQLAKANPQTYLPHVAATLNNLAILQHDLNDNDKAEADYTEALDVYRQLAGVYPQAYLPYVSITLNNLATLQESMNEYYSAEVNYNEALGNYRKLAEANPQTYLRDVAVTLVNISIFYTYNKGFRDRTKALGYAREAITIALPFSASVPACATYIRKASKVLKDWGEDPEAFLNSLKTQPLL